MVGHRRFGARNDKVPHKEIKGKWEMDNPRKDKGKDKERFSCCDCCVQDENREGETQKERLKIGMGIDLGLEDGEIQGEIEIGRVAEETRAQGGERQVGSTSFFLGGSREGRGVES